MNNPNLLIQKRKIDDLIRETEELSPGEISANMAKYICLLCSGFMENAVFEIYSAYVNSKTRKRALINYVDVQLLRINNPNSNKLREIAKSFKITWEEELKEYMQDEERSTSLNAMMRERHKIAHGKNSTITIRSVKEYFSKCIEIVSFIEQQCENCPE